VAEPGIESSQVCGLIERSGTENAISGCVSDVFFGGDTAWCSDRLQVYRRLVVTSSGAELNVFESVRPWFDDYDLVRESLGRTSTVEVQRRR
jgi:hypothetical protein